MPRPAIYHRRPNPIIPENPPVPAAELPAQPPAPPPWPTVRVRLLPSWPDNEQPGDMFYLACARERCTWSNCDGKHLVVVLPNGAHWDVDSRASNCTKRDERTHRCWVRKGDPGGGDLHIDKDGDTCAAGAGSILSHGGGGRREYHGHLHHGELRAC